MTGMTLHPLPDGWTPIEAVVLVKCLDHTGRSSWAYRTTAAPNLEELLGVFVIQTARIRKQLVAEWDSGAETE